MSRDGEQDKPAGAGPPLQDMPALTALRAVAALLVFVFHFPPWGFGRIADIVVSQGHVGVTVFFVLSGFLITVRYYPQFERGKSGLADYFVRRAARILPLYYVVLTLTHVFSTGSVPLDAEHLPEWTLTQALFDASPEAITVPTSWSLTVEECFYASAPFLFLALAAMRRRIGAVAGAGAVLVAAAIGIHLGGTAILQLANASGVTHLGFLTDEVLLRSYTIFGRFPEFVLGGAAGLVFLSGRVEAVWRRRGGTIVSTLLALGGAALLVAAQAGMARDAGDHAAEWRWNLVVALASTALVVALTCRRAPLSRALAFAPAVYLGRISYALYLIQLTPLGKGLLFPLLPAGDVMHVVMLYVGMNVVSALLFELVEEPARETLLDAWRGRSSPAPRGEPKFLLSSAVLFGALLAQYAVWVVASLPPVEQARVDHVLGPDSQQVLRATLAVDPPDGREPRLWLPASWRLGPSSDSRPPSALLVFVDGRAVPFLGTERPTGPEVCAYYRRAKTDYLSFQIDADAQVTVVNDMPLVAGALAWSRVREGPLFAAFPLVLLSAAGILWWKLRSRIWMPRPPLALAVGLTAAWLVSGLHLQPWAPLILLLEVAVLIWLAAARGIPPRAVTRPA